MPVSEYESQKDALDVLRPLVLAEETRSTNFNSRALGVITAGSVVTAIAAFFAKEVVSGTALEKLGDAEAPAIILLAAAVLVLGITVVCGVWVLWPRSRLYMDPDGWESWKQGRVEDGEVIRNGTVRDLAGLLANLREFNTEKVRRLKWAYGLYALAVVFIAVDAMIFFLSAL